MIVAQIAGAPAEELLASVVGAGAALALARTGIHLWLRRDRGPHT